MIITDELRDLLTDATQDYISNPSAALRRDRAIQALQAQAVGLAAEVVRLRDDANRMRAQLSQARDQGREPDYCYDEEWEYTMKWNDWPGLMDGHDLTEPMALYTLYNGPTKWVVRVPTGDGSSKKRLFDSEDEARAAITPGTVTQKDR